MNVSIIIPNWNGKHLLEKNLPNLLKLLKISSFKYEVIVVDDGSVDESIVFLKKISQAYRFLKIIKNKTNLGFGESVNKGVIAAKYEIVLLLNTDVQVEKETIPYLLNGFKDKNIFAVGANENGKYGIGDFIYCPGVFIGMDWKVKAKDKEIKKALWVCGGNTAFRRQVWIELGGLSPLFKPFYYEETDLCYRAWKRGYKIIWNPKAKVKHLHKSGTIRKNYSTEYINFIIQRNQLIFVAKNISDYKILIKVFKSVIKKIYFEPRYLKIILTVMVKIPEILATKIKEAKMVKISDREILSQFPSYLDKESGQKL